MSVELVVSLLRLVLLPLLELGPWEAGGPRAMVLLRVGVRLTLAHQPQLLPGRLGLRAMATLGQAQAGWCMVQQLQPGAQLRGGMAQQLQLLGQLLRRGMGTSRCWHSLRGLV